MTTPRILRPWIRPLPDLLDRLQQVVGALQRKVRGLDRNQQMGGSHQRVHRQETQRGWTVDDDMTVLPIELFDLVLQPEMRVELTHQPGLELRKRDPSRSDEQVLERSRLNDGCELAGGVGKRIVPCCG